MWNKFINNLIFLLITWSCVLSAQEQQIEWAPSKSAKSYKLEIRDFSSKKLKVDTKVKATFYKVDKLSPNLYEYRIGIVNDKDQVLVYSDWTTLSIIQSFEPEGSVDEVYYGGQADKFQEIYITGTNFYEDTKVEVFSGENKIPITSLARISQTELKFVLNIASAKPGTYDLKIINPLNKVYIKNNFYLLGKTRLEAEKKIIEASRASQGVDTSVNRKYFVRSIFIPGWGQINSGKEYDSRFRKLKGGILLSAILGASIFLGKSYREFTSLQKETKDSNTLNNLKNYPFNPPISIEGLYLNQQFNSNVHDLEQKWRTITNVSYAIIGIYLINLIDAYFFTGPIKDLKQNAFSEKKTEFNAFVLPEKNERGAQGTSYGIEYRFRF